MARRLYTAYFEGEDLGYDIFVNGLGRWLATTDAMEKMAHW